MHNTTFPILRARLANESGDSVKLLNDISDNPICSVTVDETVPYTKVIWKRYATTTQLGFIHESILHLIQEHRVNEILGDDAALPTIAARIRPGLLTIGCFKQSWLV